MNSVDTMLWLIGDRSGRRQSKRVTPCAVSNPVASSSMASIHPSGTGTSACVTHCPWTLVLWVHFLSESESDASAKPIAKSSYGFLKIPADYSPPDMDKGMRQHPVCNHHRHRHRYDDSGRYGNCRVIRFEYCIIRSKDSWRYVYETRSSTREDDVTEACWWDTKDRREHWRVDRTGGHLTQTGEGQDKVNDESTADGPTSRAACVWSVWYSMVHLLEVVMKAGAVVTECYSRYQEIYFLFRLITRPWSIPLGLWKQ